MANEGIKSLSILDKDYLEEQFTQQAVEQKENTITPQLGEQIRDDVFSIGWGHHKVLIDKYSKQSSLAKKMVDKALFGRGTGRYSGICGR